MTPIDETVKQLASFRRARESVIQSDECELEHHLREFVREIARNEMCQRILKALAPFDAAAWWAPYEEAAAGYRPNAAIEWPEDPDEKLSALWSLVSQMGSGTDAALSYKAFGQVMGARKFTDAAARAISWVVRPFAEAMTDRLREAASMLNPDIREVAGLPLAAVPSDSELRVFLSHSSMDKERVQPYFDVLSAMGHQPWLDARDMPPGTVLHRGIASGIDSSCAIVFFVTANFADQRWLAQEIDRSIERKIQQGEKFSIVTVVYDGGVVPSALQSYVWIKFKDELKTLREILAALPLELGRPRWKERVYRR